MIKLNLRNINFKGGKTVDGQCHLGNLELGFSVLVPLQHDAHGDCFRHDWQWSKSEQNLASGRGH